MKNRLRLTLTIGLIAILSIGITSVAATTGRKANLQSVGNVDAVIDGKQIYISSGDLRYLADEIDNLEDTYKINTVDALNSIGTYFKTDGTVVYDAGANEVDSSEEKSLLSFKSLKEGIAASQSVVSLSQTQATDKDGRPLYYADKAASDSRNLMKTTTMNTGYPVYYQAVTAENLTAGTAAWVDGILVKGNGANNSAYYNEGLTVGKNTTDPNSANYKAGYAAGTAASKVGTATADKVLTGYTFTNSTGVGIAGTMVNRGALNWNPTSNSTQTIQPGYYSGGTLNSSGAYNAGLTAGKNTTDPDSANYKAGYTAGTATSKVGTATADKVLTGYTFTNSTGAGIAGTMANRGTLNWNPTSNTTQTVQPGYYSGGTLNSSGAYNAGIAFADSRVNRDSESYKEGEAAGIDSLTKITIRGSIYTNYGGYQDVNFFITKNSAGQWIDPDPNNKNPNDLYTVIFE